MSCGYSCFDNHAALHWCVRVVCTCDIRFEQCVVCMRGAFDCIKDYISHPCDVFPVANCLDACIIGNHGFVRFVKVQECGVAVTKWMLPNKCNGRMRVHNLGEWPTGLTVHKITITGNSITAFNEVPHAVAARRAKRQSVQVRGCLDILENTAFKMTCNMPREKFVRLVSAAAVDAL
jgi:hypothetical protein